MDGVEDTFDHRYREALGACATRYIELVQGYPPVDDSLHAFVIVFANNVQTFPLEKLNRWLGYIQGRLIALGKTTVDAERDWTRPLFRPLDFPDES